MINYHVASFSFLRHSVVTLNINLSPLPTGEKNFEQVPENIAGKSAWNSWQSGRGICIYMKSKLPEENGSSELLFHLHGSMSSLTLLCLENPTEAADTWSEERVLAKRQTSWTVPSMNTCFSIWKDMLSGFMGSFSESIWKQAKSCFSVCVTWWYDQQLYSNLGQGLWMKIKGKKSALKIHKLFFKSTRATSLLCL